MPIWAVSFGATSAERTALAASAFMRSTIGCGVPAGA